MTPKPEQLRVSVLAGIFLGAIEAQHEVFEWRGNGLCLTFSIGEGRYRLQLDPLPGRRAESPGRRDRGEASNSKRDAAGREVIA